MNRYNVISSKNKREMLLLKGTSCIYGKCSFCNYILDNSNDLEEINRVNFEALSNVTGIYKKLEIVNSGSVFELPKETLIEIKRICEDKCIEVIYFEAYFSYINRLIEIVDFFPNQKVRFRIGLETFDDDFRVEILNKKFYISDDKIFNNIKNKYWGVLLMICIKGQTKEGILNDINMAIDNFNEVTISVFNNNDTVIEQDDKLLEWFSLYVYPNLIDNENIEILIDNKDLGVYVQ